MNVFIFYFEPKILTKLLAQIPSNINPIVSTKPSKCIKFAKKGDVVFLYNYTKRSELKAFIDIGCIVYPNEIINELCKDRIINAKFLDDFSRGTIHREYFKKADRYLVTPEKGFVYKVGNAQQGDEKYSIDDGKFIIRYNHYIKEEFIEGRSFRVLVIGDSYYIIEQTNSRTWIKNRNPDSEIVFKDYNSEANREIYVQLGLAIKDALYISKRLKRCSFISPTLGFDYVINKDRFCLLEMNDMCGLPDDDAVINSFTYYCSYLIHDAYALEKDKI